MSYVRPSLCSIKTMTRTQLAAALILWLSGDACALQKVAVSTAEQLQKLFSTPTGSLEVCLQPGVYHLVPLPVIDSSCGNCENAATLVEATVGLHVRGKKVHIRSRDA